MRISDPAPVMDECNRDAIAGFTASGMFGHSFVYFVTGKIAGFSGGR
jgi:hypothetical protein